MKINNLLLFFFAIGLLSLMSCEKDDPIIPIEEEVITTVKIIFTSIDDNSIIEYNYLDADGEGGNDPIITTGNLKSNTSYTAETVFLNETTNPVEDITTEIQNEGAAHQIFYHTSNDLEMQFTYNDEDVNGYPIGINSIIETGLSSTGILSFTLRHEPKKPNNGTLADAGGETDIAIEFDVNIQ